MFQQLFRIAILVPLLSLLLVAISNVQDRINQIKESERLTDTNIVENAPPIVAFTTVALGAFRGLVADILWLRSSRLQEKGQYFEMVQLASWITKLQPRFTGATAYLAWNMAYNISVTFSSPEDRWRWVQRGLELIRDEGIVYNPGDALLYKELGWIYQHKIGNIMDDANRYYKTRMVETYTRAFGSENPDWARLASAPENENDFLTRYPPESVFWKALKEAGYRSLSEMENDYRQEYGLPEKFLDKYPDTDPAALARLDAYFRARMITRKYKLKPQKILNLNQRYGKLDWRLPEAHAIYWASEGIDNDRDGDIKVECERMISQSLKDAFMSGRLLMVNPDDFRNIMFIPNLNVVDAVKKSYVDAWERHGSNSFRDGMKNFMKDAIVTLYTYGRYEEAREKMREMQEEFPKDTNWKRDLDKFVLQEWAEDAKEATMHQAMGIIDGLLYRCCVLLAYGDHDGAVAHEQLARKCYLIYRNSQQASWERVGLPPFDEIKRQRVEFCLMNFPPDMAANLRGQLQMIQVELKKMEAPAEQKDSEPVGEKAYGPIRES